MTCRRFTDRVAVISGAAHGIGRACAERFAAEGACVVLLDRDERANEEVSRACQAHGGGVSRRHRWLSL